VYTDLRTNREFIQKVVTNEEISFNNTLTFGTERLNEVLDRLRKGGKDTIPGIEIFKLYDTFGFPVDLVEETAKDTGFKLDMKGFERAMQEQREKAMASWKGSGEQKIAPIYTQIAQEQGGTLFDGYGGTEGEGNVAAILKDQKPVDTAHEGDEIELILDETPFYGESGGQVGDTGWAFHDKARLEVTDTQKPLDNLIVHKARVVQGTVHKGDTLSLKVDERKRIDTANNHSATHLLHAALKEVLGPHIKQAGSLVAPDRLRFDYTHFSPLTEEERERIEALVNEKIRENLEVETKVLTIDDALEEGAVALFGEKYDDHVRVVDVPGFSKELCGGTHVPATGTIGFFKITSEGGIASGVRRIEAVTGSRAYEWLQHEFDQLSGIRKLLKAQPNEEVNKIKKLLERNREMEKEIGALKEKLLSGKGGGASLKDEVQKIGDVPVLIKKLEGMDPKSMRSFIDNAKNQIQSGVVVAGCADNGKVMLAAGVTNDLTDRFHAGNILKEIAGIVGGSGGGRPDMAQAGGSLPEKLDEALGAARDLIGK